MFDSNVECQDQLITKKYCDDFYTGYFLYLLKFCLQNVIKTLCFRYLHIKFFKKSRVFICGIEIADTL